MARQKSKKWSDYLWLVSATYFTLGFFNIVFAWLGVICFMIPLFMAVFGGGKGPSGIRSIGCLLGRKPCRIRE